MSGDEIKAWYKSVYPDDPATGEDHFIITGYRAAYNWHGDLYNDAFEALYSPDVRDLLNGRGYAIRAFVRAYDKGAQDKPEIVSGLARTPGLKRLGGGA